MAKKKNTKKPVSKRTTRATLDERNERLGKTDAPKPRKPRAQKIKQDGIEVTITEGPATQWVSGSTDDFLNDTDPQVVSWTPPAPEIPKSGSFFIPNYPNQKIEFTKINKNGWTDATHELYDDFISKMKKTDFITVVQDFAFTRPLIFGIVFCTAVLMVVAAFGIAARIFGW
jgi:hypothetical protein